MIDLTKLLAKYKMPEESLEEKLERFIKLHDSFNGRRFRPADGTLNSIKRLQDKIRAIDIQLNCVSIFKEV